MKKILSILVCLIVMITLVIPKTEVNAKGEYFEHAKTLHFKDDVERSQASTRVQYSLVSIPLEDGTRVPGIEYVFTFNPEYNELPGSIWTAGQKIGFILPYAVGVPTKIVKTKSWKTGGVDAVPDVKRYEGRHILVDWLSNQDSQDYASKLTKEEFRVGHVFSEAYKDQKNSNKDIDLFDDRYKSYVLKGYENEARTSSKSATDIQGFNNLKNYLDSKEGANQMFASWETANSDYKFTFVVEAPLRDPQNPTDIIRDVNRISEVAEKDLQAYAFISSDNKSLVHMYRVNGVSATINDLQNSKGGVVNGVPVHDGIADSNRNQLSEIKKLSVINAPALTYTDTPFNDDEIKNKVLVHGGGERNKEVTKLPEYQTVGGGMATVKVTYPDGSFESIEVPTLSIKSGEGFGNEIYNNFIHNEYSKIKHLQDPETVDSVLKLSEKEMILGIKKHYEAIRDNIGDQYKFGDNLINKDIQPLLDKIASWEKQIKDFKNKYRDLLNSNAAELSEKEKISNALKEYEEFNTQVKEALKTEKEKLEKLLEIIKKIEEQANAFNEKHKTSKVEENENKVLDEYKNLNDQEKEALKKINSELSEKLEKAEETDNNKKYENEATKFKEENKTLLNKEIDKVKLSDEKEIDTLKEKYDLLDNPVKKLLEPEKEQIDKLLGKIEELKKQNSTEGDSQSSPTPEKQPEGNSQSNPQTGNQSSQGSDHENNNIQPGETLNQKLEYTTLQHSKITAKDITDLVKVDPSDEKTKGLIYENGKAVDVKALTKEAGEKLVKVAYFKGNFQMIQDINVIIKKVELKLREPKITLAKGTQISDDTLKNNVYTEPNLEGISKEVTSLADTNQTGSQTAKVTVTYPNGDTEEISIPVEVTESNISSEGSGTPESGNSTQPSTPGPDTGSNTPSQPENTKPQAPEVSAKEDGSVTIIPKDSNTIDTITITYTPEGDNTTEKTLIIKKDSKDNNKWKLEGTNPGITIDEKTGKVTIPADKIKDNTKVTAKVQKGDSLSSETSTDTSKPNKQTTPNTNQGSNGNTTSPSNPSTSNNQTKPQANYLFDKNTSIKAIHDSYKDDEYELIIERKPNIKPTNLNNNQGIEVYDIKVRHKATKQLVTNFNPALKIYVPTTNKIIKVVHISDNDHKIQDQTYNFTKQDQGIQFSTNHLSLYGLVYENSKPKQTVTHNPNWQQDLRKHNEFISKHNKETNKTLPNTGHINNHSILLASTLLTLVAYKLYKKED